MLSGCIINAFGVNSCWYGFLETLFVNFSFLFSTGLHLVLSIHNSKICLLYYFFGSFAIAFSVGKEFYRVVCYKLTCHLQEV